MGIVYRNETSFCGPISMLKRLESGELLLVFREALWRGFSTHGDPTTRTSLIRSTDDGETWHSQVTPDSAGGNGASINQLSDGTVVVSNFRWAFVPLARKDELRHLGGYSEREHLGMASGNAGVHVVRSSNDGYTWEPATRMDLPLTDSSTAGRVIELADGTLLAPLNGQRSDDAPVECWVMRSSDKGKTWRFGADVAPARERLDYAEMRLLAIPSGRILAAMRTRQANFHTSHSDDGGKTWSPPVETPIWCEGSSPFDLQVLADGRILATYGHRRPPWGVRACLSDDEGMTWNVENERVLRDDGLDRDMGYPSSQQLGDGSILTVYYWHGEDQIRHLVSTRWSLDA